MARVTKRRIVEALLATRGRTYAEELGIDLGRNTPSALFRWLCAATLFSARIGAGIAFAAARELSRQGWTTPAKLAAAGWEARARTLNEAGYARYDERTSAMLGDTAERLQRDWGGDLRRLREAAGRDPAEERRLLKQFKGIGDVGADIFCREVQTVWDELYPFADRRALEAAAQLGLGGDARALARLVEQQDFARLVAALVRVRLQGDYDAVRQAAAG